MKIIVCQVPNLRYSIHLGGGEVLVRNCLHDYELYVDFKFPVSSLLLLTKTAKNFPKFLQRTVQFAKRSLGALQR